MPRHESINFADVTLAVLAGGAGTRMGRPKAYLTVGDEPILSYLLRTLHWPGPTLLVTAPSIDRPPGSEKFSAIAIDPVDGNGPLQGVHTALQAATTPIIAIATVDMPMIHSGAIQWLAGALQKRPDAMAVMCQRADQDQIEPFPSLWRSAALPLVSNRLENGRRSVHGLIGPAVIAVDAPAEWGDSFWLNVNFPADFQQFLASQPPAAP